MSRTTVSTAASKRIVAHPSPAQPHELDGSRTVGTQGRASILGVCRVDTRRAVALLGHTDARMTMGVYAQLLKLGDGNVELLEQLMGCTRDEARAIFESEPVLRTSSERDAKKAPALRRSKEMGAPKSARLQAVQRSG